MIFSAGIDATVPRALERGRAGTLRARVVSALVLAPVAVACIWAGGIAFELLVGLAAAAMVIEWGRLTGAEADGRRALVPVMIVGVAAVLVLTALGWLVSAVAAAGLAAALAGALAAGSRLWPVLGVGYVAAPMAAAIWLRGQPDIGRALVLWLVAVVWATDIAAYFVGRTVGGPKLAPGISPGKTWSGLGGGVAAAAAVGGALGALFGVREPALLIAAGAAAAVVAQAGDLLESALKRRFGAKDAGALIPGHGGVLDRLDGLLTVSLAGAIVVATVLG